MKMFGRIDAALVASARAGDAAALAALLDLSRHDLARFARRACATSEDAEDAVQIALWQLHRNLGTLHVIAAFMSWLFRIVERECRRLLRLSRRAEPLEQEAAIEEASVPVPLDLRRDLSRAIAALPPIYREVLILRDIEELTAPEAAEQLGISVEAVKSRLHRARSFLREALTSAGYLSAR
jgi:RNA polymerase sigma factor (sigma-70 family)